MAMESTPLSNSQQLDDLNSSLNVVLDSLKADTKDFPPLEILEEIKHCLECLVSTPSLLEEQRAKYVSLSWPANLRIVVSRLFRTFKIPEEYIHICYELCNIAAQGLGAEWMKSDSDFLRLLSSLSSGRLRVILDKPSEIDMAQLIACLQLQEYFISCVEDEQEWLSDEDATFVGKHSQEAASFVCEYLVECARQTTNVALRMDLFMVLYRFVCAFLSIGGAQLIDKQLLSNALPVLITVCQYCLTSQRDADLAWYLLGNLPVFGDPLPSTVLALLLQYVELTSMGTDLANKSVSMQQFNDLVEQFVDRQGWYTAQTLDNLENLANIIRKNDNGRLANIVRRIRKIDAT